VALALINELSLHVLEDVCRVSHCHEQQFAGDGGVQVGEGCYIVERGLHLYDREVIRLQSELVPTAVRGSPNDLPLLPYSVGMGILTDTVIPQVRHDIYRALEARPVIRAAVVDNLTGGHDGAVVDHKPRAYISRLPSFLRLKSRKQFADSYERISLRALSVPPPPRVPTFVSPPGLSCSGQSVKSAEYEIGRTSGCRPE
jgi:hypothetical protein